MMQSHYHHCMLVVLLCTHRGWACCAHPWRLAAGNMWPHAALSASLVHVWIAAQTAEWFHYQFTLQSEHRTSCTGCLFLMVLHAESWQHRQKRSACVTPSLLTCHVMCADSECWQRHQQCCRPAAATAHSVGGVQLPRLVFTHGQLHAEDHRVPRERHHQRPLLCGPAMRPRQMGHL